MKREIKFRAWNGETMDFQFVVGRPQAADCLSIMTDEKFAQETYKVKEWKVMQYTGLKDKNGTDIYEGDILEFEEPRFESEMVKAPVIFHAGSFVTDGAETFTLGDYPEYQWEIIGNIYSNPDLLPAPSERE